MRAVTETDTRMASASTSEPVWQFHHSIECDAPPESAWLYWTNIANWNDPPASFHLDGPFDAGSRLTTSLPGQTFRSVIRQVIPNREAIIDMHLPGAVLSFHWNFESLPDKRTRITQRIALAGTNAKALVAQATVFEPSTPEGMKKLVAAIEENWRTEKS